VLVVLEVAELGHLLMQYLKMEHQTQVAAVAAQAEALVQEPQEVAVL
jgi:hypothetical protein